MRRRRGRPRPKRRCRNCGADVYAFQEAPLCDRCTGELVGTDPGWTRRAQVEAGNRRP